MTEINLGSVQWEDDDKNNNIDTSQKSSPDPTVAPVSNMDTPRVPKIDFGESVEWGSSSEQKPSIGERKKQSRSPRPSNKPDIDVWARDNPDQDTEARSTAAELADFLEPGHSTIISDSLTLGGMQKIAGLFGSAVEGRDREYGERLYKYYIEEAEKRNPGSQYARFISEFFGPGKAKKALGVAAESAALSGGETLMKNTPSEGLEGVGEAAGGGALVGGTLTGATRALGRDKVNPDQVLSEQRHVSGTGDPGESARKFQTNLRQEVSQAKGEAKSLINEARDSDFRVTDNASGRLNHYVRRNVERVLQQDERTKGLVINREATPASQTAIDMIDKLGDKQLDEMSIADIDNLRLKIQAQPPMNKADKNAKNIILDQIDQFADVADYTDALNVVRKVQSGNSKALDVWRQGRNKAQKYLSVEQAKTVAGHKLKAIIDVNQDMTARDLADITWGLGQPGNKRQANGVVDWISENSGPDSKLMADYRAGMLDSLTSGKTPTIVKNKIDKFLTENAELADKIFDEEQIRILERFSDQVGESLSKKGRNKVRLPGLIGQLNNMMGLPGEAAATIAQGIREAGPNAARAVARETGEPVGEMIDRPAAQKGIDLLEKAPNIGPRDALIQQLQGVQ